MASPIGPGRKYTSFGSRPGVLTLVNGGAVLGEVLVEAKGVPRTSKSGSGSQLRVIGEDFREVASELEVTAVR
jgi:hypothetical protein